MTTLTRSDAAPVNSGLAPGATVGTLAFHVFLGAHSFLIGLLPFYLPVWLWRQGMGLDLLSIMIGISGLCFALMLGPWERIGQSYRVSRLIEISFVAELILISVCWIISSSMATGADQPAAPLTALPTQWLMAVSIGIAAGTYSAFFWTTQRALFAASLGRNDAGKRYGNFQIYVAVVLKLGILCGGFLLDMDALTMLVSLSLIIAVFAFAWLRSHLPDQPLLSVASTDIKLADIPVSRTRRVFLTDGVFLLLESHFWTLSLFLFFGEDFTRLGTLVVALGIAFTILFWLSKNLIDRFAVRHVYIGATLLYALSWLLRSTADNPESATHLGMILIVVTFATSFFRLAFNKRFFEHARAEGVVPYLVWKSRLSQTALGVVFLGIGLAISISPGSVTRDMSTIYLIAALFTLMYFFYPRPAAPQQPDGDSTAPHVSLDGSTPDRQHG